MSRDRALTPELLGDLQVIQNRLVDLERSPRYRSAQIACERLGEREFEGYEVRDSATFVDLYRADTYATAPVIDYDLQIRNLDVADAGVDWRIRIQDQTSAVQGLPAPFLAVTGSEQAGNGEQFSGLINLIDTFGEEIIGRRIRIDVEARHTPGQGGTGNMGARMTRPMFIRAPQDGDVYVVGEKGEDPFETHYYDEFSSGVIPARWTRYNGPGNDGFGLFSPAALDLVQSEDALRGPNVLRITAENDVFGGTDIVSGGFKINAPFLYGQVEMRVRTAPELLGVGGVTSGRAMLDAEPDPILFPPVDNPEGTFPAGGRLEIFSSADEPLDRNPQKTVVNRLNPAATPPYVAADNEIVVDVDEAGNGSQFNVLTYTWSPTSITLRVNDGEPYLVTSTSSHIPSWPMDLEVRLDQLEDQFLPGVSRLEPGETIELDIDYIHIRTFVARSTLLAQPFRIDTCTPVVLDLTPGPKLWEIEPATSQADWDAAMAAMDGTGEHIVLFKAGAHSGEYRVRGNEEPSGPAPNGVPGAHNVVTCEPGATITQSPKGGIDFPAIDIAAALHWDVVNCTIISAAGIGIRYQTAGGTAGSRCLVSGNTISGVEEALIAIQGWFQSPWTPTAYVDVECNTLDNSGFTPANPDINEGIYVGTGATEWVDFTNNVRVRRNLITAVHADAFEIKTGATDVEFTDNLVYNCDLAPAGISTPVGHCTLIYANSAPPGPQDVPANILFARNRLYNLTQASGPVRPPILMGRVGTIVVSNIVADCEYTLGGSLIDTSFASGGFGPGGSEFLIAQNTSKNVNMVYNPDPNSFNPTVTQHNNYPDEFPSLTFVGPTDDAPYVAGEGPMSGFVLASGKRTGTAAATYNDVTDSPPNSPPDPGAVNSP